MNWWEFIDVQAAVREQFPTLREVRNERPGCRTDKARQEFYRAENQASVQRAHEKRWEAAVAANGARMDKNRRRAENAAYKNRNKEKAA